MYLFIYLFIFNAAFTSLVLKSYILLLVIYINIHFCCLRRFFISFSTYFIYCFLVSSSSVLLMGAINTGSSVWPAYGGTVLGLLSAQTVGESCPTALRYWPLSVWVGAVSVGVPCGRGLGRLSVGMAPIRLCFLT